MTERDGRKLLRLEVRNAETPIEPKPEWIKTRAKMGPEYKHLQNLVKSEGLHTACQEDFCQIETGKPEPLDRDEPRRVAESVQSMGLRYATITGVARDDLADGGAWLYAETVRIRPAFRSERSLVVITQARDFGLVTKSNLILGMGETREEVSQALSDLHAAGCELITITQYLRPSVRHHPVERWVKPEEFVELQAEAEHIGFSGVMSGPLVRSSYRAGRLYRQAIEAREGISA